MRRRCLCGSVAKSGTRASTGSQPRWSGVSPALTRPGLNSGSTTFRVRADAMACSGSIGPPRSGIDVQAQVAAVGGRVAVAGRLPDEELSREVRGRRFGADEAWLEGAVVGVHAVLADVPDALRRARDRPDGSAESHGRLLRPGPPVVETLARRQVRDLTPSG